MTIIKKHSRDVLAFLVIFCILYLFYRSIAVIGITPIIFYFYHKQAKRIEDKKRKDTLSNQFKDALVSLSAALRAGYSMENAIKESCSEMCVMYGADAPISTELKKMINQINLGIPVEKLFSDLAQRTQVDDIETFASVYTIAKRSGGDVVEIIRKTASDISAKVETKNEIAVQIASKKFEQNIMNAVPMAMIVYVSLTSGEIMDNLYGNITGVIIMTICLGLYAFAFVMSRRIMNIEV